MESSIETLYLLRETQARFHNNFEAIKTIEVGDKLSIYDDKLYIDKPSNIILQYIQPILRYLQNQGRYALYCFLNKNLTEYSENCKQIKDYETVHAEKIEIIRNLKSEHSAFVRDIIVGLDVLKITYTDYTELCNVINDFKHNINLIIR